MDLLDLNLDCWLLIADILSYKDILNIAKVSSAYESHVKIHLLPSRFKSLDIDFSEKRDCINEEDFRFLLDSIWPTVESVHLFYLSNNYFELLKLYCFPCATEMWVDLKERGLNDTDTRALGGVFPNLRTYHLFEFFGIHKILPFTHLENLSLRYCINVTIDDIRHILLALNLKSLALDIFEEVTPLNREEQLKLCKLEEITLNCYELSWLSSYDAFNPFTFTNLKVLIVTRGYPEYENINNLFSNIKCIVPRDVYELELGSVFKAFMRQFMLPEKYGFLNNIQKLKCLNSNILMDVFGVPGKFKSLRELHFRYCHTTHKDALQIASNSQRLDSLSFKECCVPAKPVREHKLELKFSWYPHKEKSPVFRPVRFADDFLGSIWESRRWDRSKITFKWKCSAESWK